MSTEIAERDLRAAWLAVRKPSGRSWLRSAKAGPRPVGRVTQHLLRWLRRWFPARNNGVAGAAEPRRARGAATLRQQHTALPGPLLMLMQGQLTSLLGQHPHARGMLPHLALVERVLRRRGEAAVWALPDPVIARALAQLEALTDDWSQAGLAELRTRLAAVARPQAELAQDNLLSTFGTPDKLVVSEVGLSVFEELEASHTAVHHHSPRRGT